MVKLTLTEEQEADVLSAFQQISGHIRTIETILARATTIPEPVAEPSFEQALNIVLSRPEFIDYITEQVEEIVDNFDANDLCELDVDEGRNEVRISLERKWSAPEAIAQNVKELFQDIQRKDSYHNERLLFLCRPDEQEEQEEA